MRTVNGPAAVAPADMPKVADAVHVLPLETDFGGEPRVFNPAAVETDSGLVLLDVGFSHTVDQLEEGLADSEYGLSSYLFTDSYRTAMRVAEDLDFGETYINRTLGESWHAHHTGWNESGLGGEDGKYGFYKYTKIKTVYHNYS